MWVIILKYPLYKIKKKKTYLFRTLKSINLFPILIINKTK